MATLSRALLCISETPDMMHTNFQCERFADFFAEARELIKAHWHEVASFPEIRRLDVDEQRYLEIERKEMLLCVTARRSGALIGYIVGLIAPDLHAKAHSMLVSDAYYVEPPARREGVAQMMFNYYNAVARQMDCAVGTLRQKLIAGKPMVSDRFFEEMGYEKQDVVWMKKL